MGHFSRHQILGSRSPSRLNRLSKPSRTDLLPSPLLQIRKRTLSRLPGGSGTASNPGLLAPGPKHLQLLEGLAVYVMAPSFRLRPAGMAKQPQKLLTPRAVTLLFFLLFGSFKVKTIYCTRDTGCVTFKLTGFQEGPPPLLSCRPCGFHVVATFAQTGF